MTYLILHIPVCVGSISLTIQTPDTAAKMALALVIIDNESDYMTLLAHHIQTYLKGGWQKKVGFEVDTYTMPSVRSKKEVQELFQKGYATVIFMDYHKARKTLEWRIYDAKAGEMLKGKRISGIDETKPGLASWIADELWTELTGQEGIFYTKIAYCQDDINPKKKRRGIYLTTSYEYNPELLLHGGKFIGPRWNKKRERPLLYYSEITPSNIRLMSVGLNRKKKKIFNNDGITMLPSCSTDGKKVIYCASPEDNSQLYCYEFNDETKESTITCLTNNKGNNVSPHLRDNGDIIFCSNAYGNASKKHPHICYYTHATGAIHSLIQQHSCMAPALCESTNTLAYVSLVGDTMQLFTYNLATKHSCQLTFTPGNKDEPTWSPGGNYIAFSVEYNDRSRIALMNIITQEWSFLTPEHIYCSYPSWSPRYSDYIAIT
jgi:TolB protein